MSETERNELIVRMMIGDLDKPYHLPECECEQCENWRRYVGRETRESQHRRLFHNPYPEPPHAAR